MQIQNSIWHASLGYWQNSFIHQHFLMIGYAAWHGFLTVGKGMVVCNVDLPINAPINWKIDIVPHQLQFIAQSQIAGELQQLRLESDTISPLQQTIATYEPSKEIVILLNGGSHIEIHFLQRRAISPADCYEQVCQRWDEFRPCMTTQRRNK